MILIWLCGDNINRYLWDANVLLHEWRYNKADRPTPVTDEQGVAVMKNPEPTSDVITWVYEDGNYVPSAKLVNNERFSIVSDYLGRPVQAYNDTGELVWQTDYDIYGGLRNLIGDRELIPFRQLGQYEDEETGLYYNRFRWYDPNAGSYLSQDPIGLAGNNPTLYGYVNDANRSIDILGLSKDCDVTNSAGDKVTRRYVKDQEELLAEAEKAAGGNLDDYINYKPDWYKSPDGKRRIEWNTSGHFNTNEGPHVTVRDFDGKRHSVTDKIFIEGRDLYDGR